MMSGFSGLYCTINLQAGLCCMYVAFFKYTLNNVVVLSLDPFHGALQYISPAPQNTSSLIVPP